MHSCGQHGTATVWLVTDWPGNAIQVPEALAMLGVHCLSQCAIGLHYQIARTVSKARETATNLLEFSDTPVCSNVEKHSRRLQVI
jgi:hypothetical protein